MISLGSHHGKMLVSIEGCPRNHTLLHKQSVYFKFFILTTFILALRAFFFTLIIKKMFIITAEINVLLSVLFLKVCVLLKILCSFDEIYQLETVHGKDAD